MRELSAFAKIFVSIAHVDFRKQVNGLSQIVQEEFGMDSMESGSMFVFRNKRSSAVKILYWDTTGFAMWSKRLEKDKFPWPKLDQTSPLRVTGKELKMLLQGIDFSALKPHEPVTFSETG